MPSRIPAEPHIGKIVSGLLVIGLAGWLLLSWLPSHRPMTTAEQVAYLYDGAKQLEDRSDHWMFQPPFYVAANTLAVLLMVAGLAEMLGGVVYRPYALVTC